MCLSTSIKSQIIFSTNNQFAADVNVYVTDNQFSADLVVYRCDSQFSATKNAGLWHFTSNQFSADKIIYFTDNQFASDLIIYFTSNQFAAGWSDKSLMHLMYNWSNYSLGSVGDRGLGRAHNTTEAHELALV